MQPAKRTGPSIFANIDTTACLHVGEQHAKLDKSNQADQIASSHHRETHLFRIPTTQVESFLKKKSHNLNTRKTPTPIPLRCRLNIFLYQQAQGMDFWEQDPQ